MPPKKKKKVDSNMSADDVSNDVSNTQPSTSQKKSESANIDETEYDMYASLLFDDKEWYSDDEVDPESSPILNEEVPLDDILGNLASQINADDGISKFNISRSKLYECVKRGLRRKSFNPKPKISVKFTHDAGSSEGAVDAGGPMREMLTLSLSHIHGSQIFDGGTKNKFLSCISSCVDDNEYYMAGQMIALCLVHGGIAPHFFAYHFFDALVHGPDFVKPTIDDLPENCTARDELLKLKNASL
ncbi:G2/M phase-specific E3 ubiquitin-protein ligase-like, partial [Saccoglossus kowalevskii]